MTHRVFSLRRCLAIAYKEALQLRRDRFTFGMIIGIPVVQLLLFGYAINNDPKHLPTAFVPGEETIFTRSVESALRTSDYFRITGVMSEKDAENALKSGDVSFVINIPTDFTRRLLRGEKRPANGAFPRAYRHLSPDAPQRPRPQGGGVRV